MSQPSSSCSETETDSDTDTDSDSDSGPTWAELYDLLWDEQSNSDCVEPGTADFLEDMGYDTSHMTNEEANDIMNSDYPNA